MTTMAYSAPPLKITLSIGNVSFHLTPSPSSTITAAAAAPSSSSSPSSYSPTKRHRSSSSRSSAVSSPYAAQKRSHRRITTPHYIVNAAEAQQQQHHHHHGHHEEGGSPGGAPPQCRHHPSASPSPPIVAIRHGRTTPPRVVVADNASPTATATTMPGRSPRRHGNDNDSPLKRHILGSVRAARDKIETRDHDHGSRRNNIMGSAGAGAGAGAAVAQCPLLSPRNISDEGDYCVDLNSFTGTLHISTASSESSSASGIGGNASAVAGSSSANNIPATMNRDGTPSSRSPRRGAIFNNARSPGGTGYSPGTAVPSLSPSWSLPSSRKRVSTAPNADDGARSSSSLRKKKRAEGVSSSSTTTTRISSDQNEVEMSWSDGTKDDDGDGGDDDCERGGGRGDVMGNNDGASSACRDIGDSIGDSRKSVRFSIRQQDSVINPATSEEESAPHLDLDRHGSSNRARYGDGTQQIIAGPNASGIGSNNNQNAIVQSPPPRVGPMSRHFFSSPPTTTFPSPQRSARETARASVNMGASVLARSGKHLLKQITLAGKDAYDALNDAVASPDNNDGTNGRNPGGGAPDGNGGGNFTDSGGGGDDDDGGAYNAFDGTELHYACASDNLAHARALLKYDNPADLHTEDCDGKLPIHVLTENERLVNEDPLGCEEVAFAMIEHMGPERAVQALHPCGLGPLVYVIGMWTERLHGGWHGGNSGSVRAFAASSTTEEEDCNAQSRRKRITYRSLFQAALLGTGRSSLSSTVRLKKLLYLPTSVTISDHVRWSIRILSRLIDEYPEQTREAILTNIASVPLFLKSLLLIGDMDEMTELLGMSLVKHVIVDKRSINVWLCAMLTDSKDVKMRAVTFMKLLSRMTLTDLAESSQSPDRHSEKEIERFATLREDTFNAVYVMPGIVPAVLELGGRMIENLSTTRVMRYITNRTIQKQNVFFVLLVDFFYALFLLMGFRLNVEFVLSYNDLDGPEYYREFNYISVSTMAISCYFLAKEAVTLLSLTLTSEKLAKRYCSSVFKIIDVVSVAMLLGSEVMLTSDPSSINNDGFAASLTIILLWLKLMGAFKVLNSAFSLFLFAVHEVIKEVKWFLMFLFAVTLMFSDAVRTVVTARGDCDKEEYADDEYVREFCSDNLLTVIIRMYSVLAGDVALEYFKSSDAMMAVFIFFSFFSIIILLNILIAIIIDSYEGTKQRSREIFYRARFEYAAHLVARKQFLSSRECSDFPQKARRTLRYIYMSVSTIAFLSFQYGFFGASYYLALHGKDDNRMIISLMLIYVSVAAIFNAYMLSVVAIGAEKRYSGAGGKTNIIIKRVVQILDIAVKCFHQILGFNADKTDFVSEEILIAGEEM